MDNLRIKAIITFLSNFSSVDSYVKGITKKGILEELGVFDVLLPQWLSYNSIKSIYVIVLRDYIAKNRR